MAVTAGLLAVAVPALAVDQLLHATEVYPPWGEPMHGTRDNLLALGYRLVFTVAGGWVAARLAPRAPVRHALALGAVGTVLALAGAVAAAGARMSPTWFLAALVLTALPCAWLGGRLALPRAGAVPPGPGTRGR